MEFSISLTIDKDAAFKASVVDSISHSIRAFVSSGQYGTGLSSFMIIMYIIDSRKATHGLHKLFRPKYTLKKIIKNRLTGELLVIEKQFDYSVKLSNHEYDNFIALSNEQSKKIIVDILIDSLDNFNRFPSDIENFDKVRFVSDIRNYLNHI